MERNFKMTTPTLPEHIGGFQHLGPHVRSEANDIIVRHGKPLFFNPYPNALVADVEAAYQNLHVYREMPCPRQGGDRALTKDEMECQQRSNTGPLRIEQTYKGPAQSFHRIGPTGLPLPTEAKATLPTDAKERKNIPIYSGFLKYFPLAVAYVAQVSKRGNDQHNPGTPLHWDRSKSGDELDAAARHLLEAGSFDSDGTRHSGKAAWRSMANLQKELEEAERKGEPWFKEPTK